MDLQEIRDYLYCPLLYYLKHRTGLLKESQPERTTLELPRLAVQQALAAYALDDGFKGYPWPALVQIIWKSWFQQRGVGDDIEQALIGFHAARLRILEPFFSGKVTKRGGGRYKEPRLSRKYQDQYRTATLNRLSDSINASTLERMALVEGEIADFDLGPYSLANAYSDSLLMASNFPLPAPSTIYGVNAKVCVPVGEATPLTATADLITVDQESATVYIHDGSPNRMYLGDSAWIAKRIELIAAAGMQAQPDQPSFPPVGVVVYRHLLSGSELTRKLFRPARLFLALEMAVRGIGISHYPANFLSGNLAACRQCSAYGICARKVDLIEQVYPGLDEIAQAIQRAGHSLDISAENLERLVALVGRELSLPDLLVVGGSEKCTTVQSGRNKAAGIS
jgi:hypothetical protein